MAFEEVMNAVSDSSTNQQKQVVIVKGGPGTGKSVIALKLLGEFARAGLNISHATGSKAFTETLRDIVGRRAGNVFRYFDAFGAADENELDVLICDEAHRIRATSNSRFTRRERRSDLPQVDELVSVARVPVFLLDENQVVRPYEIGTVETIGDSARRHHARVREVDLNGQFRLLGSEAYVEWVERLLGIRPGGPIEWTVDDPFDLRVADSAEEMETWLRRKNSDSVTARIAAGYCWPWSDPEDDGSLVNDVQIGSWTKPWNARPGKKKLKDAPIASLWASDPRGFEQVGCIYTAQGFEYDFGGTIFGADFVWRDGGWAPDKSRHADGVVKKALNFDVLVRNIYKVLLTRGLKGCGVLSTDPETQEKLKSLIPTHTRAF